MVIGTKDPHPRSLRSIPRFAKCDNQRQDALILGLPEHWKPPCVT